MNKCAFVVPLHPKHFQYGYTIIGSLNGSDADVYFVFTTAEDKNIFQAGLVDDIDVKGLILSDFADIEIVDKTKSYVSIKKLFALSVLYKKYDYISCIDSEIKFLRKNNFYNVMKSVVDKQTICGGKVPDHHTREREIIRDSTTLLVDERYHNDLQNLTEYFTIYTWWSNLPVYDCKIAEEFLQWINFHSNNLDRFCWNVFDDMTYNFFCILIKHYKLEIIPNCFHSLELCDSKLVEYTDQQLCKLYWVNNKAYLQNKDYYDNSEFYIIFHIDRF